MLNIPQSALQMLLSALNSSTDWNSPNVHLYVNNVVPAPSSVLASFTECTQTGYGAGNQLAGTPSEYDYNGDPVLVSALNNFFGATAFTSPQTAYGAYLTNGANNKLLAAGRFPASVTFAGIANVFAYLASYGFTMNGAEPPGNIITAGGAFLSDWGYLVFSGSADVNAS
jgi:hypothetical protein